MRDPAVFDEIAKRLRHLWAASPSRTVCGLIYGAADPAGELDFLATSDAALLRNLQGMAHFSRSVPTVPGVITTEHLAALDEARDYDAASSYNYLNAELAKLRDTVLAGGAVRVEGVQPPVTLGTDAQFKAWVRGRYPHATCV